MRPHVEKPLRWLAPDESWRAWPDVPDVTEDVPRPNRHSEPVAATELSFVAREIDEATGRLVLGDAPRHRRWLNALTLLARHFLTWNGMGLALHNDPDTVLEAQALLGRLPLEPLLACGWVADIDRIPDHAGAETTSQQPLRPFTEDALERLWHREPLIPSPAWPELERLKREGLVEPHRHLSGSGLMPTFWLDILRDRPRELRRQAGKRPRRHSSSYHARDNKHELADLIEATRWLRRALQYRISHEDWPSAFQPGDFFRSLRQLPMRMGLHEASVMLPRDPDLAPQTAPDGRDADLIRERRFLCRLLRTAIPRLDDYWLHCMAHAYIAWQAIIWRQLVQAREGETGFARFNDKHGDTLRYAGPNKIVRRMIQAQRTGHVRYCAWRITPNKLFTMARELDKRESDKRGNDEGESASAPSRSVPRPKPVSGHDPEPAASQRLIAHWVRLKDFNQRETSRHKGLTWLRRFMQSRHAWRLEGVDIANSEFHGWVGEYAQTFRRVRHGLPFDTGNVPRPHSALADHPALRFTPHAGEDFFHPLSGMRAMDETLRFLDLQPGDRIGHGLAMGIDPALWFRRAGREVAMRRGDWLDNLVWFRRWLLQLPDHAHVVHQLETEIHTLANITYGSIDPSLRDLEQAWELRRYPTWLSRWIPPDEPVPRVGLGPLPWPDPSLEHNEDARRLWQLDVMAMKRQALSGSLKRHSGFIPMPEPVHRRNEIIRAYTPPEWDDALRAVQDHWLRMATEQGIVLEANPGSNLCISIMKEMEEHPVFRWVPLDGPPNARVVIGSDDPGVVATELAFEYACLLAVARMRGMPLQQREAWISEFQKQGMAIVPSPQGHFQA